MDCKYRNKYFGEHVFQDVIIYVLYYNKSISIKFDMN